MKQDLARMGGGALVLAVCFLLLTPFIARGVEINEVCAANRNAYMNANGATPDWIELYNPEEAAVELSGYWISDDPDTPLLFSLDGFTIEAGGYLVLAADERTLPFNMSSGGETLVLTNAEGESEHVQVPPLATDHSYSRQAGGVWAITDPTPNKQNASGEPYVWPVFVIAPRFSQNAGFYNEGFSLELSAAPGCEIYYTLDGSVPDANDTHYESPIVLTDASFRINHFSARVDISVRPVVAPKTLQRKGTIVRAVAIDADGNASAVKTNAYFIGFQDAEAYSGLPVLSIVADESDLFDSENGIYMLGTPYRDWLASDAYNAETPINSIPSNYRLHGVEIPADIQWFEADRTLALTQALGLRIHGNFSRHDTQKSLKLYARGYYSKGSIDYSFWPGLEKTSRVVVRNGGNNRILLFLDAFAHRLLSQRGLPISESTPCLAFINGEFWGLYNIRESQDAEYIAEHCGVSADEVIIVKNGKLQEGWYGEDSLYQDMLAEISSLDCAQEEAYARAEALIDIDSYTDYLAGGIYISCVDWLNIGNNFSLWRTRTVGQDEQADTRWRWIYQDLDYSCGYGQSDPTPVQLLLREPIFSALWASPAYREKFLTRIMDIANIDCAADRVDSLLGEMSATYRQYIDETYQRFSMGYTLEDFDARVQNIRNFFERRPAEVAEQLQAALSLDCTLHTLSLTMLDNQTTITLNGKALSPADGAWKGQYFSGCSLTLQLGDMIGFDFVGWYENNTLITTDKTLTLTLETDRTLAPRWAEKQSLLAVNESHRPHTSIYGTLELGAGLYGRSAALIPDAEVSASCDAQGSAITLMPSDAWSKRQGVTFTLDSAGYRGLNLECVLSREEGAPENWRMLYSLDGNTYHEFADGDLRIRENETVYSLRLPDAMADRYAISIRLEAKKSGEGTITINHVCIWGEQATVSLAGVYRCIDACSSALGAAFTPPDAEALAALTDEEAAALVRTMHAETATALVQKSIRMITEEDIAAYPALEGLLGQTRLEITDQTIAHAREILLPVDKQGIMTLYRLTEGALRFESEHSVSAGTIALTARVGEYVLLPTSLNAMRYTVAFTEEPLPDALVDNAFAGHAPAVYAWVSIERHTVYQEDMTFTLPQDGRLHAKRLYLYTAEGSTLSRAARLSADATGVFDIGSLPDGVYLALTATPDQDLQEEQFISDYERSSGAEGLLASKPVKLILLGVGVVFVMALAAAFVVLRRRRQK